MSALLFRHDSHVILPVGVVMPGGGTIVSDARRPDRPLRVFLPPSQLRDDAVRAWAETLSLAASTENAPAPPFETWIRLSAVAAVDAWYDAPLDEGLLAADHGMAHLEAGQQDEAAEYFSLAALDLTRLVDRLLQSSEAPPRALADELGRLAVVLPPSLSTLISRVQLLLARPAPTPRSWFTLEEANETRTIPDGEQASFLVDPMLVPARMLSERLFARVDHHGRIAVTCHASAGLHPLSREALRLIVRAADAGTDETLAVAHLRPVESGQLVAYFELSARPIQSVRFEAFDVALADAGSPALSRRSGALLEERVRQRRQFTAECSKQAAIGMEAQQDGPTRPVLAVLAAVALDVTGRSSGPALSGGHEHGDVQELPELAALADLETVLTSWQSELPTLVRGWDTALAGARGEAKAIHRTVHELDDGLFEQLRGQPRSRLDPPAVLFVDLDEDGATVRVRLVIAGEVDSRVLSVEVDVDTESGPVVVRLRAVRRDVTLTGSTTLTVPSAGLTGSPVVRVRRRRDASA